MADGDDGRRFGGYGGVWRGMEKLGSADECIGVDMGMMVMEIK
ncbi:hypothetical protein [Candidatus Methanocrinis natronophilus]|uniref:Uncharacterized protein n=1 Tax=Candidatus Methanocrinis natronophilus TaxID=3033396 RepID=A0ABT5X8T5_9EURY|nr:hypothetical protein [Candidatus Methanocrinis natronophilus]MDF0591083.1 hypothetical protein [Candidatus Methanocrinis natronophilus]